MTGTTDVPGPDRTGAPAAPADAFVPHFVVMDLLSVVVELPSQFPTVTLQEQAEPFRQVAIPIGLPEGVALTHASRAIATPRPLTHELFADVLAKVRVDLVAVRLVGRRRGTYLAELDLMAATGHEVVACRPSDGLTLALRMPVAAPLLADERLLGTDGDVEPAP